MDAETRLKLHELVDLVFDLNQEDFHVWFRYSGHVDCISVDFIPGGWKEGRKLIGLLFDGKTRIERLSSAINELNHAYKERVKFLEKKDKEQKKEELAELARLQEKYGKKE